MAWPWEADQAVLDALREALVDHLDDYAGQQLAYTLVKFGCRKPETLANLHPWHSLMYRWSEDGITATQAVDMLRKIGIVGQVAEVSVETLERQIQNPFQNMDGLYGVLYPLIESRIVGASFDRHIDPDYGQLFQDLANAAIPPVILNSVKQYWGDDLWRERRYEMTDADMPNSTDDNSKGTTFDYQGDDWIVLYEYQGVAHTFLADRADQRTDGWSVIENFNRFMDRLGRSEQAFRLADSPNDGGEWGFFFVADRHAVAKVVERLHIPLLAHIQPSLAPISIEPRQRTEPIRHSEEPKREALSPLFWLLAALLWPSIWVGFLAPIVGLGNLPSVFNVAIAFGIMIAALSFVNRKK